MKKFIKIITTFIVIMFGIISFSPIAFADYFATTTLTTSGNFTVPLGVTSLNVSLTAAGGGGGGGAFTYGGGGGGGGSSISNIIISVTPGQIIPYTVGLGGTSGTTGSYSASGGNGGNGGNTTFNITNIVLGGLGGQGAVVGGGGGIGGLAGGAGATNGTNGDSFIGERHYGGNGGTSPFGSAGVGGYGSASTYTLPTAGVNGNGGGGGSGFALYAAGSDAGAQGGDGLIVVSYYADLTTPVITLNGSSTITIAANSVYTDLGATAIDNIDGDITANIITTGLPVNTNATGTNIVVYTVTDLAGNTSSSTRTVIVTDQTAPVITVPGIQEFEATGATTTPSIVFATAIDNIDANPVVVYAPSDFTLGTSTVVWTATDSSGNSASSTSLVVIKDTTAPTVTMNGSSTMSFMVGNLYTELGADALDLVDGTTSVSIMGSVNGNVVGTYFIIYSSTDLSGNNSSVFRTINVTPDTISPIIIAPIDQLFEATGATTTPVLVQATSTDNFTVNPAITYAPSDFTLGTTTVVWTATDDASNFATTTSLVTILDTTAPVITMNGSSTIDLFVGDIYVELGASSTDLVDGSIIVSATGTVDTNATGTYNVFYTATDSSLNVATTSRTVNVTLAPATLTSISISPINPSMFIGATTTFVSTTLDQYSNPFATTTNWNSSDISVGTIDAGGLFTAISSGTTTITATAGPLSTSTIVTVNSSVTVSIINSTVEGIFYVSEATSSNAILGITGTTNITNSTVASSIINDSTISTSTVTNSNLNNCTILDSSLDGFIGSNCFIDPTTIVGPSSGINATSTGTTTIINSNFDYSTIDNSYLSTSTVNYSTVVYSYISTSTVINSTIDHSTTTLSDIATSTVNNNSIVNNSELYSSNISSSTVDNTYVLTSTFINSDLDNSISTNSTISTSTVDTNSVIDGSAVFNSDITNSTLTNLTIDGSTSTDSVIVNSIVSDSEIINSSVSSSSNITNSIISNSTTSSLIITNSTTTDSTISSSTLSNVGVASSTITNSNIFDAVLVDAVIIDDVMSVGSITSNGTTTIVSTSTPLTALINYAPITIFSVATSSLDIVITDNTTDPNEGTAFVDSWIYNWSFGDGATSTISTLTTNGSVSHTYATSGTYIIDLLITDAYGATSSASVSITVSSIIVPDITPPVITITGSNPVSLVVGNDYTDLGATALDNVDGDLTSSIVTINPVSSSTPIGSYSVTYSVMDSALNSATATRTVNVIAVPDAVLPVITILGSNPVNITIGSVYTDAGATSTDNIDGDLTGSIVTTGLPINTSATGTQYVVYTVTDSSSNIASSTRTVNIIDIPVDTIPPVITINGGTPITITVGSSYIDAGATAYDAVSGTTTVTEIFNDVNTSATGTYSVVYSATDVALNTATTSRIINVIATPADNIAPVITITGGTPLTFAVGGTYTDVGATAVDDIDGVITVTTISNNVDPLVIGSYSVSYSAIDAALNNSTAIRTVNIVEATSTDIIPPVITITGGTPITIQIGGTYTDQGATAIDDIDGSVSATTTSNDVNTSIVGAYTVVYSATDVAGNISTATRNVNVVAAPPDIIPPVITLIGGTPITIAVGSTYSDAGATAYDAVSGTTTVTEIFNDVNTSATGTYSVVYSATDVALNTATTSRTVNVVLDGVAPVVTVLGLNPMTIIKTLSYTEDGAVAVDNIDATTTVVISGSVDINATGTYTIIYSATDSSGNTGSSTRTVNIIEDNIAPVITILGSNPVSLIVGDIYIDAGATSTDNIDGDLTLSIATSSDVNTSATGTYSVTYTVTDAMGNTASSTRIVNVNPVPPPTLSSIAITNPANKLTYTVGESLDITGLIVVGTYSDSSTSTETITSGNISGFNSSVAVTGQVLIVTVGSATTTYSININAAPFVSGGGGGGIAVPQLNTGDINFDNKIDEYDFSIMMSEWGKMFGNLFSDLNHDSKVDEYDFSLLMFNWK